MNRFIAAAAVATIATTGLAACGGDDEVTPDQLRSALVAQGIDESLADCIVDDLENTLSTEDFDTVARADEEFSDVPQELVDEVTDTITACAIAEADG